MDKLSISSIQSRNVYFGCTKPIKNISPEIENRVSKASSKAKRSFAERLKKLYHTQIGKHLSHFSKAEIQRLEKCSMEEFYTIASELCAKSYGIPKELQATMIHEELNPALCMAYIPSYNKIIVNSSPIFKIKNRPMTFGLIKHEHLHQKQTLDILRTEEFGLEAIDKFAKDRAESGVQGFVNAVRNVSDSELKKMLKDESDEIIRDVTIYRNALKQGPQKEQECIDKFIQVNYELAKKELMAIRKIAIEKMGLIKENTKESSISREYFEGIMGGKGKEASLKTIMQRHEKEAYTASSVGFYEYLFAKIKSQF